MSAVVQPYPPWLEPAQEPLRQAFAAGRMPHALLIHESPGAGGECLATWCAQLVLCLHPGRAPCGSCTGCRRVASLGHPDLVWVVPEEDGKTLRIEQVRELSAVLGLTSHAGGYKVGVLSPADALTRFAANALLKTLEEPAPRTLLILIATQPSRLPPTVLSRCQRIRLRSPARAQSLAWLEGLRGPGPWAEALDVVGEAPLRLKEADAAALVRLGQDVRESLDALAARRADPVAQAERWARDEWPLRLQLFENWLTERLRAAERAGHFMTEMRAGPYLSGPGPVLNIRDLFRLMDEVRELRATLDVALNRGLALEVLFRRLGGGSAGGS